MQRLIFESSPIFIFLCAAIAFGYAYVLYRSKHTWSKRINQVLFGLRAVLVFFLAILLLGPVIKLITNQFEKPSWVFLIDSSASVAEVVDSTTRLKVTEQLSQVRNSLQQQGYQVKWNDLEGNTLESVIYNAPTSDLNKGIQHITQEFEGKNLAGIILVSDGIYNSGLSPLYTPVRMPIHTIAVGDSIARVDLVLKNVAFNKVAYQGNKFPIRAQVLLQGLQNLEVVLSVSKSGKSISMLQKNSADKTFLDFDFQVDATEKGIQRFDLSVKPVDGESNKRNNDASVFIEVVEGKKKIVMIAPAPHPDIKAMKTVVEKNSNYEFVLHIPGIAEADPRLLTSGGAELYIFHQVLDQLGKTSGLFSKLYKSNSSVMLMIGGNTNLRQLQQYDVPIQFESSNGQWDDVTPVINNNFRDFGFSENSNGVFARYPPAHVPFGKFSYPPSASALLYQRIGSITTDRPMLMTWPDNNRKIAVMIGDGMWRWRLNEFADTGNTVFFDELFSKLIQYLSTLEDKRKFRAFPLQNEFSDSEPVVIESQVYNDLFELVYGNAIRIEVRNEQGEVSNYSYVTSPGSSRYRIGGLKEGIYRFKASTTVSNNTEEVNGQFLVKTQNLEAQNLTADFGLLRKLADETGGKFYKASQLSDLTSDLNQTKVVSLIHSEETFNQLINLKWVFFLLLALVSAEWFMRKYLGSY
ncbi:MAG: VWA domain-containing protein [Cyclobacteriaceae bacterium]|nr:VWA domain-containing protein [Cyclobacteriaceae bacterium]